MNVTGFSTRPAREQPLGIDRARGGEDVGRGAVPDLRLEHVGAGEVVLLCLVEGLEDLGQRCGGVDIERVGPGLRAGGGGQGERDDECCGGEHRCGALQGASPSQGRPRLRRSQSRCRRRAGTRSRPCVLPRVRESAADLLRDVGSHRGEERPVRGDRDADRRADVHTEKRARDLETGSACRPPGGERPVGPRELEVLGDRSGLAGVGQQLRRAPLHARSRSALRERDRGQRRP